MVRRFFAYLQEFYYLNNCGVFFKQEQHENELLE